MLKVNKLNKYYHNFGRKPLHVINNTTIEIPETGIIAVIGESGAGKTTLINTISGLDSFKNGEISFDDVSMRHYKTHVADQLRMKNYGFIFQNYYLLESETVYENVRVALDAFEISEADKKKRINYVLGQLGIAKYTHKKVTSLSGGERQRVSIARALVKSPRIIFADEPTGSLDEKTTFNVLNILKKVSQNCAVFIVTHERDIISYYADYVIELDNGVVVKESKPIRPEEKSLAVDRNVYLNELKHVKENDEEGVKIDFYSDNSLKEKGEIKVAIKDGVIYLEASENIKVLTKDSENHLIAGDRYQIKDFIDKNDFDYSLEPLTYSHNRLSLLDIIKKGYRNYRIKKPIKNVLKIICVFLTIALITIFEGFNTINNMNFSDKLKTSKGNLYLTILPESQNMNTKKLEEAYEYVCEQFETSEDVGKPFFLPRDNLFFTYEGFFQLQQKMFQLPSHDFKDIDTLEEQYIVYGNTPSNPYEIILDEYVLEQLISTTTLSSVVTDYGYFVGKKLTSGSTNYSLTISGVCRTNSPTLYAHKTVNLFRVSSTARLKAIDIDYAKEVYPQFKDVTLQKGHCLRSDFYGDVTFKDLIIDDRYGEEVPFDLIIHPDDYATLKYRAARYRNDIYIQTDGSAKEINKVYELVSQLEDDLADHIDNGFSSETVKTVSITIANKYQDTIDEETESLKNILNSVEIIGIVIGVIALLLIVLSTYLSMLNQISDIAVYRSLGYSRLYLGLTYFVELSLISFISCLIGGGLTYLTMFILDVIPIVPYTLSTPLLPVIGLVMLLSLLVILIGVVPIILVFRLTPAKIYSRYNHRINNE